MTGLNQPYELNGRVGLGVEVLRVVSNQRESSRIIWGSVYPGYSAYILVSAKYTKCCKAA